MPILRPRARAGFLLRGRLYVWPLPRRCRLPGMLWARAAGEHAYYRASAMKGDEMKYALYLAFQSGAFAVFGLVTLLHGGADLREPTIGVPMLALSPAIMWLAWAHLRAQRSPSDVSEGVNK